MNKLAWIFLLSATALKGAEQEEPPSLPEFTLVKSIPVPPPSVFKKGATSPVRFLQWHPNGTPRFLL